jgi:hypothetical protein
MCACVIFYLYGHLYHCNDDTLSHNHNTTAHNPKHTTVTTSNPSVLASQAQVTNPGTGVYEFTVS